MVAQHLLAGCYCMECLLMGCAAHAEKGKAAADVDNTCVQSQQGSLTMFADHYVHVD